MRKEDKNTSVVRFFVSGVVVLCIIGLIALGAVTYAPETTTSPSLQNQSDVIGEFLGELKGEAKLVSIIQRADAASMAKQSELWAECHTAGNCGTED